MKSKEEIQKKLDETDSILTLIETRKSSNQEKELQRVLDHSMMVGTRNALEWALGELD